MKPYQNKKLEQSPDVGDIREEGRKSSVGKLPSKSGEYKSYFRRAKNKKTIRRSIVATGELLLFLKSLTSKRTNGSE